MVGAIGRLRTSRNQFLCFIGRASGPRPFSSLPPCRESPRNHTFSTSFGLSANTLNALKNISDKVFRAPKAVAPFFVCGSGGLCGDNFVQRLALFLESRHFLASTKQQVEIKGELRFVANRPVTWDHNHCVRDFS